MVILHLGLKMGFSMELQTRIKLWYLKWGLVKAINGATDWYQAVVLYLGFRSGLEMELKAGVKQWCSTWG